MKIKLLRVEMPSWSYVSTDLSLSGSCSLSSALHSKLISFNIPQLIRVPFDPFEKRLNHQWITFLDFCKNILHKIFIFDRLPCRSPPPILAPIDVPRRDAVNGIPTIGDDANIPMSGHYLKRSQYRSKLRPLVGLSRSRQGLRNISTYWELVFGFGFLGCAHVLP